MDIPQNIQDEIHAYLWESGCASGDYEYVEEMDKTMWVGRPGNTDVVNGYNVNVRYTEQDCSLSFCNKEFVFVTPNELSSLNDMNAGYGLVYFPYQEAYIKASYCL